jgi:hypothetical protein
VGEWEGMGRECVRGCLRSKRKETRLTTTDAHESPPGIVVHLACGGGNSVCSSSKDGNGVVMLGKVISCERKEEGSGGGKKK